MVTFSAIRSSACRSYSFGSYGDSLYRDKKLMSTSVNVGIYPRRRKSSPKQSGIPDTEESAPARREQGSRDLALKVGIPKSPSAQEEDISS